MKNINLYENLAYLRDLIKENSKNIIFLGSWHGVQETHDLLIKFIKFFCNEGFRDVILELPVAAEEFYNFYLKTGKLEYWPSYSFPIIFKQLHEFYETLPENKKIHLWCIDIDHDSIATDMYLNNYIRNIRNKEIRSRALHLWDSFKELILQSMVKAFQKIDIKAYDEFKRVIKENNAIRASMSFLSSWFHEVSEAKIKLFLRIFHGLLRSNIELRLNYILHLKRILRRIEKEESLEQVITVLSALEKGIRLSTYSLNSKEFIIKREAFLKEQFKRILKLKKEKIKAIAFLGSWHIMKAPYNGITSVGAEIAKDMGSEKLYSIFTTIYDGEWCNTFTGKTYPLPKISSNSFEAELLKIMEKEKINDVVFLNLLDIIRKIRYTLSVRVNVPVDPKFYDGCILIRKAHKLRYLLFPFKENESLKI